MRWPILLAILAMPSSGAGAADGFPGGTFGQRDGCRYAKTGESSGADDFLLIDREAITTSTAVCHIRKVVMTSARAATLTLACESGDETGGEEAASATLKNGAWTVRLSDGTSFGPAKRCP
ncbi:hypothetical protein [Aureimonas pseudogalii]|uniref:Secreted protein n=1 Tax=Aureimonas pseudogalii TaxID=1744844 RepID=A0A7W6H2A6_9HYPH|nr:hypothetical protein [Aureimonas pseudogalii]MBB3996425.1 hypothetical protein [Aureimonas pseudogalii]